MSYIALNTQFLNKTIDIKRKTTAKDAYGGLTESWSLLYTGIKGNIQETDNKQMSTELGEEVTRTHICFLNDKDSAGKQLILIEGDKLFDRTSNILYRIIGVKRFSGKSGEIHHHKLDLSVLRQDPTKTQSPQISAKASIVH